MAPKPRRHGASKRPPPPGGVPYGGKKPHSQGTKRRRRDICADPTADRRASTNANLCCKARERSPSHPFAAGSGRRVSIPGRSGSQRCCHSSCCCHRWWQWHSTHRRAARAAALARIAAAAAGAEGVARRGRDRHPHREWPAALVQGAPLQGHWQRVLWRSRALSSRLGHWQRVL
jgi:hypothetical protein